MQVPQHVPQALLERAQWVTWRDEDGRKVPYNPNAAGRRASSTDPETWSTFDTAQEAAQQPGTTGLGFVFQDGDTLFGIDLDECIDAQSKISSWAIEILRAVRTYAEVSPSGRGIKLFCRGQITLKKHSAHMPPPADWNPGDKAPGIEVYTGKRYFTFTGRKVKGTPDEVLDVGQAVQEHVIAKHFDTPPVPPGITATQAPQHPPVTGSRRADLRSHPPERKHAGGCDRSEAREGETGHRDERYPERLVQAGQ